MWGRLTLGALQHDPVVYGAVATMGLAVIGILFILFYFKRWTWLWMNWITAVDPKKIGVMYLVVAFVMLLRGLADTGILRLQQALSVGNSHGIITSDHFQQIFTAHGTMMIFFVAMGLMFGLLNLMVPLQIGARDVAFPFLNSLSFWLYVMGAVLVNVSLPIGEFAATGWLAYPPLSELAYSPGVGVDYWIWSLQIAGLGSLLSGVNFLTTILKMRAPGMTLMRMPIFIWTVLGAMILVVFSFPILTATLAMLALDRNLGMHFFTSVSGGSPMMYVNLIWAWGHPEVYILMLPSFGVFSEIVATFSRKRLFGYTSMVWAIGAITFLSFTVWLHHFFTMGSGADVNVFFGIMTMVIAIPTGVKVFNWLFTMHRGRISLASPMLWFLGFIGTFTLGGVAGVLMSVPAIDFQVHNSLFLVAHFHTMIIGGVLFGYFAGFTYWFPKVTGFKLNERLGKYAFWCWFIGFLTAFVPLYILGLMGATRRLDHYDASMGWQQLFIVAGVGVMIILAGVGFQILQLAYSIWKRNDNLDTTGDPWGGRTLEWSTASPAPFYNFAIIPTVHDRDQFWADKESGVAKLRDTNYRDIMLPKNTPMGFLIAAFAAAACFGIVWQMYWLIALGLAAAIVTAIIRLSDDETEYRVTASEIAAIEAKRIRP
jgi:cytochrome o ubiquinol oxidase subunit 1